MHIKFISLDVLFSCCFVKINNIMEDSIFLFCSTLRYLYKYLIHQLSYKLVPFHQTKLPDQLLKQFLSYPPPFQRIYSGFPIIDHLFNLALALIPISRHCNFDQTKSVHDSSSRSRVTHNTHTCTYIHTSPSLIHPYIRRTILYTATT